MQKGFTIVELVLIVSVVVILFTVVALLINPVETQRRSRDNVRLADAVVLSRAIEEYILDKETAPGEDGVLRRSDVIPQGSSGPLYSVTQGWIGFDLTGFVSKLPLDPLNTGDFVYSYRRVGSLYELNIVLETNDELMARDGGDNASRYELGTGLTLIN